VTYQPSGLPRAFRFEAVYLLNGIYVTKLQEDLSIAITKVGKLLLRISALGCGFICFIFSVERKKISNESSRKI
jgi:hypothetical protein